MMRKCHLNTCPVGVATQDPKLRERFRGRAQYVINYMRFIAEEMREYLSLMGMKTMDDVIGRTDLIVTRNYDTNSKTKKINVSKLLYVPEEAKETAIHYVKPQQHKIDDVLDRNILKVATPAIQFKGSAGQSFGAFLVPGVHFKLQGDANDYLGKGLSGGKISVVPASGTTFAAEDNIICGNTLMYGSTSGEV